MQHVESIEYYSIEFVLDLSLSTLEAASLCVCVGLLLLLCWGGSRSLLLNSVSPTAVCV